MPKIAFCVIVKDDSEEERLKRCLDSVAKWVDGIYITGTKEPQRRIKKICKEYGAHWSWFEWIKDFSAARNFAFSQVPKEYDWIFWMDTDDIIIGGGKLHSVAELAEKNDIKAVFARYLYQIEADEKGNIKNILIEHLRERLIKNDGCLEWIAPIHETMIEKYPINKTDTQDFLVAHLTSQDEMVNSMYRNIEILEEEAMNKPHDPRPLYYLAKAYFDVKAPEILYDPAGEGLDSIAMELFKDYIRKSGWPEERAQCWEYMSMVHRERAELKKSRTCLLEALEEWPQYNSIYIQMALTWVTEKNWSNALHWAKLATNVEIPKTTLVQNPRDYKLMILEALYHAYLNTGQLELCEKVAQEAVNLIPADLQKNRLRDISDLRHKNNLAHWVVKLANHLKETNQQYQLRALANSIPNEIAKEPALMNLRAEMTPPRAWEDNEVAIFCAGSYENWTPKSVAKGIGGSEEAVIYLTKELAKLGWKVTVFADPGDDEGEYDGVIYRPYYTINWQDNFNIFVAWRQIGVFDLEIKAKKTFLWNHDIQIPQTYTPERMAKIDKVIFLSSWHRNNVPGLEEDKIMLSSNGINA